MQNKKSAKCRFSFFTLCVKTQIKFILWSGGKFHKFLAVADDRQIVGYVSFIEAEEGTASFGVEIYAPFRRQGYAYAALLQLLTMANACNYHTATGQVRKDNTASLALCRKLGFSIVSEGISKRGKPVYNLVKSI